ncbi:hypothetical protein AaE_015297 [Aphanomyces astaci]|uniref:Uncharacterized protein n=1 Tax=Aphanomyces astaci TaxID=112090 RepID=A0A6A4Z101_APHAT|nr:hypothetical protein AaE_015297 [Aphanomyces astaci]
MYELAFHWSKILDIEIAAMPPRPCVADDKIEAYMRRTKGFSLGLLLGHRSSSNLSDLVLAAVPTPPEQDGGKSTQLSDISIDWMVLHATQVLGYLPGGIDCLGMYVVARDAATSLNGIKLHRHMLALRQVQTRLMKSLHAISDDDCVQYIAVASPGVSPVFKALSKVYIFAPRPRQRDGSRGLQVAARRCDHVAAEVHMLDRGSHHHRIASVAVTYMVDDAAASSASEYHIHRRLVGPRDISTLISKLWERHRRRWRLDV